MRIVFLALPLFFLVAGCGDDLGSFEGALAAKTEAYNDLADVLDSIKDKASVEAAAPKIEKIMKRIHAAEEAGMKHMGELDVKDMERIREKLGAKVEAAEKKKNEAMMRLIERIANDPEAQAALDKVPH